MSPSVVFLITPAEAHSDNHLRLPALFDLAGWRVQSVLHDDLHWRHGQLFCGAQPATAFDLVWPVGLGPRQTFLDRQELLCHLAPGHCINPPSAYLAKHGKSAWLKHAPPTYIAKHAATLESAALDHPDQVWVLKPLAGSFGRQVHKITEVSAIATIMADNPPQYWVLQTFIEAIQHGETRTLLCANEIIGSYLRVPSDGWRSNLAVDATAHPTRLSAAHKALVADVQATLHQSGIRFAAIDTVGDYVMEVNLANPGGLGTLTQLYGDEVINNHMLTALQTLNPNNDSESLL